MSKRKKEILAILLTFCVCGLLIIAYNARNNSTVSGGLSFALPDTVILPLSEIRDIIRTDEESRKGYNCVEFAMDASRRLRWAGQLSATVAVEFDEGPGHIILLVPTSDAEWVFIDPKTLRVLKPVVGGSLSGKEITQLLVRTETWIPLEEFVADPVLTKYSGSWNRE